MATFRGERLFRVAIDELGATEFSASQRYRRFSPIFNHLVSGANAVPVLYAAETTDAAIAETVFHDVEDDPERMGAVLHAGLRRQRLSALAPQRELTLADLTDTQLLRLGSSRDDLIANSSSAYPETSQWGQWVHDRAPEADGLMWNSRRDPARAISMMLFGDRLNRRDLVADVPVPLFEGPGYLMVLDVGIRLNVSIVE